MPPKLTIPPKAPAATPPVEKQPSASEKLQHARQQLRTAARAVQASECRLLDYETADEINRALSAASRDLEELTFTLAILERRREGK